jgi:hypothetical protein
MNDEPSLCEVAVQDDRVIFNYKGPVGPDGWGHLSFTAHEAQGLIAALQQALAVVQEVTKRGRAVSH